MGNGNAEQPEPLCEIDALRRQLEAAEGSLAELREVAERYRLITEASGDIVNETDSHGRFSFLSSTCRAMLGYAAEELVGTNPVLLVHEDDRAAFLASLRSAPRGQPIMTPPHRLRHRDGSWVWVEAIGLVYRAPDGQRATIGRVRNITAAVRAARERREIEQRMQQAQKLEGLGVMAGGIAHDFNNLLTPILGNASLALLDLPEGSTACQRIEKIERAAHRAASLTRQLLAYAGKGTLQFETLDLSRTVAEMGELLETAGAREVHIDYRLEAGLPPIEGDPAQLSQVIMNLITNAAEATEEDGGRIQLSTGQLVADRSLLDGAWLGAELPEGAYVYLQVEDHGCGMDAETLERMFDPFFTTKFTGRGLGLAAVQGIVRGHRGAMQIRSTPGRGSSFQLLFPLGHRTLSRTEPRVAGPLAWRHVGTKRGVLLIDDDDGARGTAAAVLGAVGLEVIEASDGLAGVELFRSRAEVIVCCVVDRTMPGAGGNKVFSELRDIDAGIPVLIVSGYAQEQVEEGLAGERVGFLQKPFVAAALIQEVRCLVDAGS